jgi:hypothetical protein
MLRYRSVLCHRQCSGRDTTGQSGHHGTELNDRGLSRATCGLYEEIREFARSADPFFKTSNDTGAKDLRLSIPLTLLHLAGRTYRSGINRIPSVEKDAGAECDPVGNPSRQGRSSPGRSTCEHKADCDVVVSAVNGATCHRPSPLSSSHFFRAAVQLTKRVNGLTRWSSDAVGMRNRLPSGVTSKPAAALTLGESKSGVATPGSNGGPVLMDTDTILRSKLI